MSKQKIITFAIGIFTLSLIIHFGFVDWNMDPRLLKAYDSYTRAERVKIMSDPAMTKNWLALKYASAQGTSGILAVIITGLRLKIYHLLSILIVLTTVFILGRRMLKKKNHTF